VYHLAANDGLNVSILAPGTTSL